MPNPDEAREEAWRAWMKFRESEDQDAPAWRRLHIAWNAAWGARGRYDEQRIAELEAALERVTLMAEHIFDKVPVRDMAETLAEALRALGQSDEVKP